MIRANTDAIFLVEQRLERVAEVAYEIYSRQPPPISHGACGCETRVLELSASVESSRASIERLSEDIAQERASRQASFSRLAEKLDEELQAVVRGWPESAEEAQRLEETRQRIAGLLSPERGTASADASAREEAAQVHSNLCSAIE